MSGTFKFFYFTTTSKLILTLFKFIIYENNVFLCSLLLASQSFCQTKKDSTIVLYTDDYSNFKNKYSSTSTIIYPLNEKNSKDTSIIFSFRGSYEEAIKLAEFYFEKNKYDVAAAYYEVAFKNNKNLGKVKDRYKVACAYTAINKIDSAFWHLFKIVKGTPYYDIPKLENEPFFTTLKKDKRWKELISHVEDNIRKITEDANQKNK